MQAAYIEELGPPEAIRYGELPEPLPGPTDVLVDIVATTVNPVDTFVRSGAWRTPVDFPFVINRDLVGKVAAAGPGAPGFAVGDWVWCNSLGHAGRQGAAAERAAVPVDRLYHLPAGVTADCAVTVAHPAATAYLALFTYGRVRAGDAVVVIGAGGNVGGAAVVLAVDAGARVTAVASAQDFEHCRSLGASEVVDYRDESWWAKVRQANPAGVDVYIDTAGQNDLVHAVELLARRGRVVLLAGMRTRPVLPAGDLYVKDCSVVGFVISHATTSELADASRTINRLLVSGKLSPRATERLPLRRAAQAHRMLEAGELRGRRVILDAMG